MAAKVPVPKFEPKKGVQIETDPKVREFKSCIVIQMGKWW